MELSPTVVRECMVDTSLSLSPSSTHTSELTLQLIDAVVMGIDLCRNGKFWLDFKDYIAVARTCKRAYAILTKHTFWVQYLGMYISKSDVFHGFSVLKAFILLRKDKLNHKLTRRLLTDAVNESSLSLSRSNPTRLFVSDNVKDSAVFWCERCCDIMSMSTYPTSDHQKQLDACIKNYISVGGMVDELSVKVLADQRPINSTLSSVFVLSAVKYCKKDPKTGHVYNGFSVQTLFPLLATPVDILNLWKLFSGHEIGDLKGTNTSIALKDRLPRPVLRVVIRAMEAMNWTALSRFFLHPGLSKSLFRTNHIKTELKKRLETIETKPNSATAAAYTAERVRDLKRVYLMTRLLHQAKYPYKHVGATGWSVAKGKRNRAEPEVVVDKPDFWDKWVSWVVEPMREINRSKYFQVDPQWLSEEWDRGLVNKRVPCPRRRTLEAVLAQDGNTPSVWKRVLEDDSVTVSQIMANLRSLILLMVPVEAIESKLKASSDLNVSQLIKAKAFVENRMMGSFARSVYAKIQNPQPIPSSSSSSSSSSSLRGRGKRTRGEKRQRETEKGVVKIVLEPMVFQDKKKGTFEKQLIKSVNKNFKPSTPQVYVDMLKNIIDTVCLERVREMSCKNESTSESVSKSDWYGGVENTLSMILLTPSLLNPVRSGIPPSIPEYTRSSLWKGESVCLEEVLAEGEELTSLLVGITWCQEQDSSRGVDLDLTVVVYDSDYNQLHQCSYTQLTCPGLTHSGDVLTAPYPDGARESVEISLTDLPPDAVYIAVLVYSFSGIPFDDLYDASVFVANPSRSGTGPGGHDIVSAARLTGVGKVNIAGFLRVERDPEHRLLDRHHFCCVDQTLNSNSHNIMQSQGLVGDMIRRISLAHTAGTCEDVVGVGGAGDGKVGTGLRLLDFVTLECAFTSRQVLVLHANGCDVLNVNMGLSEIERGRELQQRVMEVVRERVPFVNYSMAMRKRPHKKSYGDGEDASISEGEKKEESLIVYGCQPMMVNVRAIVDCLHEYLASNEGERQRLVLVNVASSINSNEKMKVGRRTYRKIDALNILEL